MKKMIFLTLNYLIIILILTGSAAYAEIIFLKDGKIIKGTIQSQTASELRLLDENKKKHVIKSSEILRTVYGDLFLGKQYLQMTSGEIIEGFIVDEDSASYVFRYDITKNDEKKLLKEKVLYLVRTNPRELKGTSDGNKIELTWLAPMGKVKIYNVYIRKEKEKYSEKPFITTAKTFSTIENLEMGFIYFIKVTALDAEGVETIPSNELRVGLTCLPPVSLACSYIDNSDGSTRGMITWKNPPGSKAKEYNIYKMINGKYEKTASSIGTWVSIEGLDPASEESFVVRSVDPAGEESEPGRVLKTKLYSDWYFTALGGYVIPTGFFKGYYQQGYAGNLILTNSLNRFFSYGVSLSGFIFKGKDGVSDIKQFITAPAELMAGINIKITNTFFLQPYISGGYAFEMIKYTNSQTKQTADFIVTGGLRLPFKLGAFITPYAEYKFIPNRDANLGMIVLGAGVTL